MKFVISASFPLIGSFLFHHAWISCAEPSAVHSLLSHAGVFQDVHVDEERLLVFAHPTQQQCSLLQQACGTENAKKVKTSKFNLRLKRV